MNHAGIIAECFQIVKLISNFFIEKGWREIDKMLARFYL